MTNKLFQMLGFVVFSFLVLTSFTSAAITLSTSTPTDLPQTSGSFTFTITSDVAVTDSIAFSANTITDANGKTITFTPIASTSYTLVANVASAPITMAYTIESGFDFQVKKYTAVLTADGTLDDTETLNFVQTSFCSWDSNDYNASTDLEIDIKDISVISGFGEDTEWYPYDELEFEIEVENSNNKYDIDDIVVEYGIFDKTTGEWLLEVTDENDFNLKDDEKKTLTLRVDLDDLDEDFDEAGTNLVFYIRATGDVDDDAGEYTVCDYDSEDASLVFESDFVILKNVQVSDTQSCGSSVQIVADVLNIGDSDQEDVYVVLYNKELGINEKVTLGDIDAFEDTKLDTIIKIPQNAEEKTYTLIVMVYNEDDEVFENDNNDESKENVVLQVAGGCSTIPLISIAASLQSEEVKAGQELSVKATLINTGSSKKTFSIELGEYSEWAEFVSIDKSSVELASKATADVLITLKINEDVGGEQTFNIYIKDGDKVLAQPVTITLEEISTNLISRIKEFVQGNGNWYLWGIGALNVILVIVIILVAVKVVKNKK